MAGAFCWRISGLAVDQRIQQFKDAIDTNTKAVDLLSVLVERLPVLVERGLDVIKSLSLDLSFAQGVDQARLGTQLLPQVIYVAHVEHDSLPNGAAQSVEHPGQVP